jgi:hypothetical protein
MVNWLQNLPGIYITAIITTILAFVIILMVILRKLPRSDYKIIFLCILLELPMSYLTFKYVRIPFDNWFHHLLNGHESLYRFLTMLYAPLTEEPAKLWPLLIPFIYKKINKENFVKIAMALGLGFGLGEIWFLVHLLTTSQPAIAQLPWYQLTGFLNERVLVCFMHGAFTSITLYTLYKYKNPVGILGSMALHYLGNLPIYFMALNLFGLGKPVWTNIVGFYLFFYFIVMLGILAYFMFGKFEVMRLLVGQMRCPECSHVYSPPFFGFNSFNKRYEKCPNCKHWHWVGKKDVFREKV